MIISSSLYLPSTRSSRFCLTDRESQLSSLRLVGVKRHSRLTLFAIGVIVLLIFLWPWKNYCSSDIWLQITFAVLFIVHQCKSCSSVISKTLKENWGALKGVWAYVIFIVGDFIFLKQRVHAKTSIFNFRENTHLSSEKSCSSTGMRSKWLKQ